MTSTERQLRDDYRAALATIDRLRVECNAALLEADAMRAQRDRAVAATKGDRDE